MTCVRIILEMQMDQGIVLDSAKSFLYNIVVKLEVRV